MDLMDIRITKMFWFEKSLEEDLWEDHDWDGKDSLLLLNVRMEETSTAHGYLEANCWGGQRPMRAQEPLKIRRKNNCGRDK